MPSNLFTFKSHLLLLIINTGYWLAFHSQFPFVIIIILSKTRS